MLVLADLRRGCFQVDLESHEVSCSKIHVYKNGSTEQCMTNVYLPHSLTVLAVFVGTGSLAVEWCS